MSGRGAHQALARLRLLVARVVQRRRSRRREDGAVFPVVIVAILTVFTMATVLFYVGRAGDLRTRAQTAADAAALGAAAEIRDRALEYLVQGTLPFAGFNQESTPQAAQRYAQRNDAKATKVGYGGLFAHTVSVDVKGEQPVDPRDQPKFAPEIAKGFAEANAIATIDFPMNCAIVVAPGDPPFVTGVQCGDTFVPNGANPQDYIHLFKLRLVDKLPPKCGVGGGGGLPPGSGKTVRPVADITPSSGFGIRDGEPHNGVDLPGGGLGAPIFAFADGVVSHAGSASGFGQRIVIDHNLGGQTFSTVYGHMYPEDLMVQPGQHVRAGQMIARVGNNGRSTGPHLHFEYWQGGKDAGHAIGPYPYVQAASPPTGGGSGAAPVAGVNFACGPGGPINGNPGDLELCAEAASAAGFTGDALVTITAIGMAESGCDPRATNANTRSVDYGLFQVNKPAHPYPVSCLFDAACNAKAAYSISKRGSTFMPWCTYKQPACGGNGNNSYAKYLPEARQAVANLG